MYFKDREEAGRKLADQLQDYRYEDCVVVALNDGAVLVGQEIAASLHCVLTMILTEEIAVPGEQAMFGTVDQAGSFVSNKTFSAGEFEEYYSEFHGYLEDQKREKFQRINRLLGDGGIIDHDMLRNHVVILVSDGLANGNSLDAAAEFLKPVRIKKLVMTTPVASIPAVDRMHILADEIKVLSVASNFLDVNHYYDENTIPSHEETIKRINEAILRWR